MSALDNAFLTAYAKNQGSSASVAATGRSKKNASRPLGTRRGAEPIAARDIDPYADGSWYRLEAGEGQADEAASTEASAETSVATATRERRPVVRRPHVRFQPEIPTPAPPVANRKPKSQARKPAPPVADSARVDVPRASREQIASIAARPTVQAVNLPYGAFAPNTVTIAGFWDALPVAAPTPAPIEPIDREFELPKTEAKKAETLLEPLPALPLRFDPPAPVAVAKPHFPIPGAVGAPIPATLAGNAATKSLPKVQEVQELALAIEVEEPKKTAPEPKVEVAPEPAFVPAPPSFEPAWEVERFSWPNSCDELLASALDDWGLAVRQLLAGGRAGCKTLAVAGLRRGEGRSTLALCLARLAAQTGAQIALVDADFENPQLANQLGVGTECDWRTALADGLPLTEAAIVCLADRLTLIPLQHSVPFKQTSFGRPGVSAMLDSAAAAYDLVLVDVGPIAGPEHTASWGGKSCPFDGVLLVRDLRRTDAEETSATVAHLRRSGLERVVVLENFEGGSTPDDETTL